MYRQVSGNGGLLGHHVVNSIRRWWVSGCRELKYGLLSLTLPGSAQASGGDILGLIWLQVFLFVAMLALVAKSTLPLKYRGLIFAAYAVSTVAVLWLVADVPYQSNQFLVNAAGFLIPVIFSVITWRWCIKQSPTSHR